MSITDLPIRPSWKAVAGAQLRMLALLQRRDFIALGLILLSFLLVMLVGITWATVNVEGSGLPEIIPLFQLLVPPVVIVAAVWPLGVWRWDSPDQRGYFWSLPVSRGRHTLIRVAMGWVLLMITLLSFMAVLLVLARAVMLEFGNLETSLVGWYAPLATATLMYLLVSCLVVALEGPMRALLWTVLGVLGIWVVASAVGLDPIANLIERSHESLIMALGAPSEPTRERLSHYVGWLTAGLVVLFLVSYRHRDAR